MSDTFDFQNQTPTDRSALAPTARAGFDAVQQAAADAYSNDQIKDPKKMSNLDNDLGGQGSSDLPGGTGLPKVEFVNGEAAGIESQIKGDQGPTDNQSPKTDIGAGDNPSSKNEGMTFEYDRTDPNNLKMIGMNRTAPDENGKMVTTEYARDPQTGLWGIKQPDGSIIPDGTSDGKLSDDPNNEHWNFSYNTTNPDGTRTTESVGISGRENLIEALEKTGASSLEEFGRELGEHLDSKPETIGQPPETVGPSAESFGPLAENFSPPAESFGPPADTQGLPADTQGLPADTQGLPAAADTQGMPADTLGPTPETLGPPTETLVPGAAEPQLPLKM